MVLAAIPTHSLSSSRTPPSCKPPSLQFLSACEVRLFCRLSTWVLSNNFVFLTLFAAARLFLLSCYLMCGEGLCIRDVPLPGPAALRDTCTSASGGPFDFIGRIDSSRHRHRTWIIIYKGVSSIKRGIYLVVCFSVISLQLCARLSWCDYSPDRLLFCDTSGGSLGDAILLGHPAQSAVVRLAGSSVLLFQARPGGFGAYWH